MRERQKKRINKIELTKVCACVCFFKNVTCGVEQAGQKCLHLFRYELGLFWNTVLILISVIFVTRAES